MRDRLREAARDAARRSLGARGREPSRRSDPFGYDECPAGEYNNGCVPAAGRTLWARLTPEQRRQWALLEPESASEAAKEDKVVPGVAPGKGQEVRFSYPAGGRHDGRKSDA